MATQTTDQFEFKAEMKQLLHLIVHSLYTHPEIFLRELISNASDALNKARFLQLTDRDNLHQPEVPLHINIEVDPEAQTFSIEDTGIGMTKTDLIERIGTVASSGTLAFLEELKSGGNTLDGELIGQFGVGFYSAFMVTDEITIETRHAAPDAQGYRWQSQGTGTFTIEEIDRAERGTKISFKLKDDAKDFSQVWRVKDIIKKYSNFVDFPILVNEDEVNAVGALWQRSKDEVTDEERNAFYQFITNDAADPLGHLHLALEGRVNVKALLFVPAKMPPGFQFGQLPKQVHLYADRVFIQDDCEALLPEYLRFVAGVVDVENLPLNVSREVTQSSPLLARIKDILTKRILGMLEDWAKNDPALYHQFYTAHLRLFALGVQSDFANRERLMGLLRFNTTQTEDGTRAGLADYAARMQPEQKAIYYLAGENRDAVLKNPNLEYFKKQNLEVLLLTDPVEVFIAPFIMQYDETPLKSIEDADLDVPTSAEPDAALEEKEADKLLATFKAVLGEAVEDVVASKRLVDSPATLVVPDGGMGAQMERMMKAMDENYEGRKKILEVNLGHPLIQNLAHWQGRKNKQPLVEDCVRQVFEGAKLIDGTLASPTAFVARMTRLMETATKTRAKKA